MQRIIAESGGRIFDAKIPEGLPSDPIPPVKWDGPFRTWSVQQRCV
ncbi:MAG: hypothetical protein AAFY59_10115 [Pseudomonadota bacterium]